MRNIISKSIYFLGAAVILTGCYSDDLFWEGSSKKNRSSSRRASNKTRRSVSSRQSDTAALTEALEDLCLLFEDLEDQETNRQRYSRSRQKTAARRPSQPLHYNSTAQAHSSNVSVNTVNHQQYLLLQQPRPQASQQTPRTRNNPGQQPPRVQPVQQPPRVQNTPVQPPRPAPLPERPRALTQEDLDMQRAIEASHETYAQEQAQRAAAERHPEPPQPQATPALTQEDLDLQRAIEASHETYEQEEAQRAAAEERLPEPPPAPEILEEAPLVPEPAPEAVPPVPAPAPQAEAAPPAAWEPNSETIRRTGEDVMQLQRQLARTPTHDEMRTHIIGTQGLTAEQAEIALNEMGL